MCLLYLNEYIKKLNYFNCTESISLRCQIRGILFVYYDRKFNSLLEYDKINKQKLYFEKDDLKLQLSKLFNTFNYYATGAPQFK